ncbi:MAG: TlpA family protein disulfide reductase [Clostridia bacterium]|nr:TlpA family protein disulfide reductase [Clostridia bacterium]
MKNRIILIIIGVLFIAALLISVKIYGRLSDKVDIPTTSSAESTEDESRADTEEVSAETAADFYAFDFNGKKVTLSEKAGKPVVVNFWATWCPPCKSELPHFEKLYKELGGEVEFMMVDLTDGQRETADIVKDFVKENGYTFPVYCDTDSSAAAAYEVYSIPVTLFIDKDGRLSDMRIGALSESALRSGIEKIKG